MEAYRGFKREYWYEVVEECKNGMHLLISDDYFSRGVVQICLFSWRCWHWDFLPRLLFKLDVCRLRGPSLHLLMNFQLIHGENIIDKYMAKCHRTLVFTPGP